MKKIYKILVVCLFASFSMAFLICVRVDAQSGQILADVPFPDPRGIAVLPELNRVYISSGSEQYVKVLDPGLQVVYATINVAGHPTSIAANPLTNRVYVLLGEEGMVGVINTETNSVAANIPVGGTLGGGAYPLIAVDTVANRIWVSGSVTSVIDGTTNSVIATIPMGGPIGILPSIRRVYLNTDGYDADTMTSIGPPAVPFSLQTGSEGLAVNVITNRIYYVCTNHAGLLVVDGTTNSEVPQFFDGYGFHVIATNSVTNTLYLDYGGGFSLLDYWVKTLDMQWDNSSALGVDEPRGLIYSLLLGHSAVPGSGSVSITRDPNVILTDQTSVGPKVFVPVDGTEFYFDNVTSPGTTTVTPIDAATAGDVPGGFKILDLAFEVATTATFSGNVETCFIIPTVNDETTFQNLVVLHNENGSLQPRTSYRNFSTRQICALTSSFSPFYIASGDTKVRSLFDRSRAFKSGSTVPVKVQILNASDQNISASTFPLTVRGLSRIGSATASQVNDAGNSNPDYAFRYDSGLQGYIYNLKTTGLAAGKYVLSFYAGSDVDFLYTVTFDVK